MGMSLGINRGMALNNTGGASPSLASIFKAGDIGQLLLPQRAGSVYADELGTTSITGGTVGLILDQSLGIKTLSGWLGLDLTPDYWIDDVAGNDSNAGTSEGAAWASLNKITEDLTIAGETTFVRVKRGTYDKASDFFVVDGAATGSHLYVVFEPGCVMDGTAANASAAQNPIYFGNNGTNVTMTIYGNGLRVQNYDNGAGGSPNGLGYGGAATVILNAWDITISNVWDGISGHVNSHGNFYRVTVEDDCLKLTVANVDNSTMSAYFCTFYSADPSPASGPGFIASQVGLQYFEDCTFVPFTGAVNTIVGQDQHFVRCHLGILTDHVQPAQANNGVDSLLVEDSYINVDIQAFPAMTYRGCYGRMSARVRAGSGDFTVEDCILSEAASGGGTGICYSNSDFGSACKWVFRNNIVETPTAAKFMSVNATNAGYLVAAGSQFHNNILSGSAAFDADLVSADTGGTVIVDNVTADALIGAANTTDPADYGYASGSPAIGAATDGGNCGFSVDDAADIALVPADVIGPDGIPGYHAKQATAADRPTLSATEVTFGAGDSLATTFPDLGTDVTIAYADPGVGAVILTAQTVGAGSYSGYVDNNGWLMIDRALTAAETALVTKEFDRLAGV